MIEDLKDITEYTEIYTSNGIKVDRGITIGFALRSNDGTKLCTGGKFHFNTVYRLFERSALFDDSFVANRVPRETPNQQEINRVISDTCNTIVHPDGVQLPKTCGSPF